jgi:hypothetical protein
MTIPERAEPAAPPAWARWTLLLLAVGVAWRAARYLLQFPIWGDEAFVCLNFPEQTYLGLTGQLRHAQIAPILFLWSELTAFHWLGGSELALRLLPLLAGVGALLLFWRLCRRELSPLAALLAVGFLAVAYYPVRHSCEVKPYASDLLMAVALMGTATAWLRRPQQLRWLVMLTLLAPVAMAASYPAVFVGGAVSLALLGTVWRTPGWRDRALYLAYNVLMLAAFVGCYLLVGREQLDTRHASVEVYLHGYWADWFPPHEPLALVRWLLVVHTGNLLAYPAGAGNGGSSVTFLLCLAGVVALWRARRWPLLILCTAPFALSFAAAWMHKYPYGGSARIAQHLAPAVCLLAATGAAALLERVRGAVVRRRLVTAVCLALVLIAAAGLVRDCLQPFKTQGEIWSRRLVEDVVRGAAADDQIVVLNPRAEVKATLQWYLDRHEARIAWNGEIDWHRLETTTRQLWCLRFGTTSSPPADLAARLARSQRPWQMSRYEDRTVADERDRRRVEHCEIFQWRAAAQ